MIGYLYIFGTILFTVFGQILLKLSLIHIYTFKQRHGRLIEVFPDHVSYKQEFGLRVIDDVVYLSLIHIYLQAVLLL